MSVIVTGGNIGFAAPHSGRVWGPMYEIFGWTPALEVSNSTAGHKGDAFLLKLLHKQILIGCSY